MEFRVVAKLRAAMAALDRWWTGWGSWATTGAGLALVPAGYALRMPGLVEAGAALVGGAFVVNVSYGAPLARLLIQRCGARKGRG